MQKSYRNFKQQNLPVFTQYLHRKVWIMRKVKVGIAGLGRLGRVHAHNIAYTIPNDGLTAWKTGNIVKIQY